MNNKIVLLLMVFIFILTGCKDNNPVDGGKPPCINCPFDFRLTDFEPAWSPDGQWIAFSKDAQIYKMKFTGTTFDTTTLVQLTSEGRNFFPAWNPDGQWIAYDRSLPDESGPAGIWWMKTDGSSKQALFGGSFPAWSPNGNILLSVIGISPLTAGTRFVLFDITRSKVVDTLLAVGNDVRYPKYSNDGEKIAFTSQPSGGKPQIWIMNSDGANLRQLTTVQGYTCDWSPTGDWIVYTNSDTVSGRLWLIRQDGSGNHQLTFNPEPK